MEKENDKKDFTKYFSIVLTCAGALLWTGGYSFYYGFWKEAELPQAFIPTSLQETIMRGMFPVDNWTGLITFLLAYGAFFLLLAVTVFMLKKFRKQKKEEESKKLISKKPIDGQGFAQTGIVLVAAGTGVGIALLIFALWASAAEQQGKKEFRKNVCGNQNPLAWKEKIILEDRSELKGTSLTIADGLTVLMTDTELHLVNIRTGPKIVQTVQLPQIKCEKEFPPKKELQKKSDETSPPSKHTNLKSLINVIFVVLSMLSAIFWFHASRAKIPSKGTTENKDNDEINNALTIAKLQIERNKTAAALAAAAAIAQAISHLIP